MKVSQSLHCKPVGWILLRMNFNDDFVGYLLLNEHQSQADANLTLLGATFSDLPHSVRFTALQKG